MGLGTGIWQLIQLQGQYDSPVRREKSCNSSLQISIGQSTGSCDSIYIPARLFSLKKHAIILVTRTESFSTLLKKKVIWETVKSPQEAWVFLLKGLRHTSSVVFTSKQEKVKGLLSLEIPVSIQNKVQRKQSTLSSAQQGIAGEEGDKQDLLFNDTLWGSKCLTL